MPVERKYHCKPCDKEWLVPNAASQHHRRYPTHEIEVLDIDTESGEIKSNPYVPGKGNYRKKPQIITAAAPEITPPGGDGSLTDRAQSKFVVVGTIRMPFEDLGYSTPLNLLTVLEAYDEVKTQFGFDGKVGDFCASLVRMMRILSGSFAGGEEHDDEGLLSVAIVKGEGVSKSEEKS